MKKQGYNDRLDESLGMRDGAERTKDQSYKDRRDESRAMRKVWEERNEKVFHHGKHHFKEHEDVDIANNMKSHEISFEEIIFSNKD